MLSQRVKQHFTLSIEIIISNDGAKVLFFFDMSKFLSKKMQKFLFNRRFLGRVIVSELLGAVNIMQ